MDMAEVEGSPGFDTKMGGGGISVEKTNSPCSSKVTWHMSRSHIPRYSLPVSASLMVPRPSRKPSNHSPAYTSPLA